MKFPEKVQFSTSHAMDTAAPSKLAVLPIKLPENTFSHNVLSNIKVP